MTNHREMTVRPPSVMRGSSLPSSSLVFLLLLLHFQYGCVAVIRGSNPTLPMLSVRGTHYEVGRQIGSVFSERITSFLSSSRNLQDHFLPFSQTAEGQRVVEEFWDTNQRAYPEYASELDGIIDGAGVPPEWVRLMAFADELSLYLDSCNSCSSPSCSDIHVDDTARAGGVLMFAHNEDANEGVRKFAYLVNVLEFLPNSSLPLHSFAKRSQPFTAYSYPGSLPGMAWGMNTLGMVFSTNGLFPQPIVVGGLARNFVNRDALNANGISDALARVSVKNQSGGFSINIGSISEARIVNIEAAPGFLGETGYKIVGNYSHFNMYKHSPAVSQQVGVSTLHRQARSDMLPTPHSAADILRILGDTVDPEFPIFRNCTPPDSYMTVSTTLFDLQQRKMFVYLSNPAHSSPDLVFPLLG